MTAAAPARPDTVGAGVLDRIRRDPAAPLVVAVVGPGGTGKTHLLDGIAAAYADAGVPVVRSPDDLPGGTQSHAAGGPAVLVDDAHLLGPAELERLAALAGTGRARLVLAHRPWPRPAALTALVAGLGGRRTVVVTHHLGRAAVAARMAQRLGVRAPDAMVDLVHEQSGGLPALVDVVTHALRDTGRFTPDRPDRFRRPDLVSVSVALAERLRHQVDGLDGNVAELLEAMAVGAPLDGGVLAPLLDRPPAELTDTAEAARASGLLTEAGELVPFVRSLLLRLLPVLRRRELQQRLASLQLERGGSVLDAGRQLLGTGAGGARVGAVFLAAAGEALAADPALAGDLLDAAVAAGVPAAEVAGRRAHAAVLTGDLDTALRLADAAPPDAADRTTAVLAAAVALAPRGLAPRGAALQRALGPAAAVLAVPALVAAGERAEADAARTAGRSGVGSLLDGVAGLMADGMLATLTGPGRPALARLSRAAELVGPVGSTALLPDGPAALAAVVGLQCGELSVAEDALRRALAGAYGGRPGRVRHRLLLAWVLMARGRVDRARLGLDETVRAEPRLEPRDELSAAALDLALARRRGDAAALPGAWARARDALLRHPVELPTLLPLGEMLVAAAELGEEGWLGGPLAEADDLLARVGRPALWAGPLRWHRLQAALGAGRSDEVREHAAALGTAEGADPYSRVLADAARWWAVAVAAEGGAGGSGGAGRAGSSDGGAGAGGRIDAAGLLDAGSSLALGRRMAEVGLGWEAGRMLARAAAEASDRRTAANLLAAARSLSGTPAEDPPAPAGPTGASGPTGPEAPAGRREAGALFSERELEIGQHILDGLTYKQIGQRLYVSAKTVEHHVARMRQRLGVETREELFGLLRTALAQQ